MPALDDIRKAIEQKIKPDQSLTLAVADVSYSDELMAFFKTLPAQTLNLGQAALSPPGSATQFQLTGAVKDTWTVLGVSNGNLAGVGLSLTCSQASPSAPIVTTLQVTKAQLALTSQSPVTLTGTLDSQAQLVLQNSPPTTARYGLDELYSFVGQTNFASDLVLKLFGNFGISSLSLTAKLGSGGLTDLGIQTSQDVQCQFLATPSIRLKSVGVELGFTVAPSAKGESVSSFSSRFSAQITLIGDYQVAFFQIKSGLWQMEVTPASGQLLPAIADLAQWAGGDTLKNLVQSAITFLHLPAATIESVQLCVDTRGKKLQSAKISGTLTLSGQVVAIHVQLPDGRLWINYPPLAKLPSSETSDSAESGLAIDDLINDLFQTNTGFPHLVIDECSVDATPSAQIYQAQIATTEDWNFTVAGTAVFAFKSAVFAVNATPQSKDFSVTTEVTLCSTDFQVTGSRSSQGGTASWKMGLKLNQAKVELGKFLGDFFKWLGVPNPPCPTLDIVTLAIDYDSSSSTFTFNGAVSGASSSDSNSLLKSLEATLTLTRSPQGTIGTIAGTIVIGKATLQATFNFGNNNSKFEIKWTAAGDANFSFNELLGELDLPFSLPDELNLTLQEVDLSYDFATFEARMSAQTTSGRGASWASSVTNGKRSANIAIQIGKLAFTGLPLVGDSFPYHLEQFTLLACTGPTNVQELAKLGNLPPFDSSVQNVNPGAYCLGSLQSSDDKRPLMFPIYEVQTPPAKTAMVLAVAPPATGSMTATNTPSFIQIQRTLGPIYIGQVGFQYQDQTVGILLNAGLVSSALEITLNGLFLGYSIPTRQLSASLDGLTIKFCNGPVKVSGGFFRNRNPVAPIVEEYSGEALIQAETFTLSALGSYAKIKQSDNTEVVSLFIFALLNYPLGGPPFFFVTGVAAGFGYNRDFILPTLAQLPSFPLIQGATQPGGGPFAGKTSPNDALQVLATYLPPKAGQNWVVAGVQFSSFQQINTVALLSVMFGAKFELALLGRSTLSVPANLPPAEPPVAYAEMVMEAVFNPDEGLLAVSAELTSESYILSKACRLTGGFAFFNWFSGPNEGQFVVTLGGYSPFFSPPPYYPTVSRVGINWQVSGSLTVKGGAYYALTPSCLMAGGYLEASYEAGPIKAWFDASADFLIAWKPFHYRARISVSIGVSARIDLLFTSFTLSAHVGASLDLWGPSFAGTASVDLSIISFTISFGDSNPNPAPISWSNFKTSFLPADTGQYCAANVTNGLSRTVRKPGATARAARRSNLADPAPPVSVDWFLTPESVTINVQSVLPILTATFNGTPQTGAWNQQIGVGPVNVVPGAMTSEYTIKLTREGVNYNDVTLVPIIKNLPKGLWGPLNPDINAPDQRVPQVLVGFEITGPVANPGILRPISIEKLQTEEEATYPFFWQDVKVPTTDPFDRDPDQVLADITQSFKDPVVNQARQQMANAMKAFGLDVDPNIVINPSGLGSAGLLQAPQLRVLGENQA